MSRPQEEHFAISKRLVAINSASSLIAKFANVTALLWAYQFLLNRIAPAEFAVLPVVTSIMVSAPLFFSFFTGGVSRYVVEAYAKGEMERVTGIVSSILPLLAATTAVFCTAGLLFAANIGRILNIAPDMVGDATIMMTLLVASFALQMMTVPFRTGHFVRQRFVELNALGLLRDVLRVGLLFCLLLGLGPRVVWVVVANVAAEVVFTLAAVARSVILVPQLRFRMALIDMTQAWQLMSFGMWTTVGRLGEIFYTSAATILLNLFGTPVDVTNYHIGSTIFRQMDGTIKTAVQPLTPVMTAMHAKQDRRRLGRTVFRGGRYALWAIFLVATPLAVYADDFIRLYLHDARYSHAALVMVLFILIFPAGKPITLLSMAAMATAEVRSFFLPAFISKLLAGTVILTLALTGHLGAVVATLSLTLVTVGTHLGYYWPLCLKMTGASFRDFASQVLLPGYLPALGALASCGILKMIERPGDWFELVAYSGTGAVVYLVILAFCLDPSDRAALSSLAMRFRMRAKAS